MVFNLFPFLLVLFFLSGYYIPLSVSVPIWTLPAIAGIIAAIAHRIQLARVLLCICALVAGMNLSSSGQSSQIRADGGGLWEFRVSSTTSYGVQLESRETGSLWASNRRLAGECSRGDSVVVLGFVRGDFVDVSAFRVSGSRNLFDRIRSRLSGIIARRIPSRIASSLASALLTGDRGQLSRSLRERFRATGTSHLLALSGMHVGILAAALLLILRRITGKGWITLAAVVLLTGLYVMISGARPSTVRAFVMLSLVLTLWQVSGRRPYLLLIWTVAVLILLLISGPGILEDTGAQMSFAAVLSLIVLGRNFRGRFGKVFSALFAGVVVTFALAPLVSSSYGGFNPVAPIATVLSLPFMLALMGLGLMILAFPIREVIVLAEWTAFLWMKLLDLLFCGNICYRAWMTLFWVLGIGVLLLISRRGGFLRRFR